jgi:hypothetical protein
VKPNLGPKHSLLHGVNLNPKSLTKVAAFDLDGTIIKQMHWSRLSEGQWEWWMPLMPSKLREVHDAGWVMSCYKFLFCFECSAAGTLWSSSQIKHKEFKLP